MPRDTVKNPEPQQVVVQPLAINYDRFKDDEIRECSLRCAINGAWRAFDGISAIGRVIEANHAELISQDNPLVLDRRTVTGLLNAIVALAESGRDQVDDYGEEVNRLELHRAAEGRVK